MATPGAWSRVCLLTVITSTLFLLVYLSDKPRIDDALDRLVGGVVFEGDDGGGIVPAELLRLHVYSQEDFVNEAGRVPSYWGCGAGGACNASDQWGPCYAPHDRVRWDQEVEKNRHLPDPFYHRSPVRWVDREDIADYCKPGFLIIGAGKCGTRWVSVAFIRPPFGFPLNSRC